MRYLNVLLLVVMLSFSFTSCASSDADDGESDRGTTDAGRDMAVDRTADSTAPDTGADPVADRVADPVADPTADPRPDTTNDPQSDTTTDPRPDTTTDTTTDATGGSFDECISGIGVGGVSAVYTESSEDYGDFLLYVWDDNDTAPTMEISIELYGDYGAPTSPGTYVLTEADTDYSTCGVCIMALTETAIYMPAAGGSVTFTSLTMGDDGVGQAFAGSFDITLQEVTIDGTDYTTTPVVGGCSGDLEHSFSGTGEAYSDPTGGSFDECIPGIGEGGVSAVYPESDEDYGDYLMYIWDDSETEPTMEISIELYEDWGAPTGPGTYTLTEDDADYSTCAVCILALTETEIYMAQAGDTITFTSLTMGDSGIGQPFAGSFDVTFQEVAIGTDYTTTPVDGGCSGDLEFSFSGTGEAYSDPTGGSFDECIPGIGEGGVTAAWAETDATYGDYLLYLWDDSDTDPTMEIAIELYDSYGAPSTPGTYEIDEYEADYSTCGICIMAFTDTATYMPVADSGSITFTSLTTGDSGVGELFAGSFDLTFQEVEIDSEDYTTTVVDGGCSGDLQHSFSATVEAY